MTTMKTTMKTTTMMTDDDDDEGNGNSDNDDDDDKDKNDDDNEEGQGEVDHNLRPRCCCLPATLVAIVIALFVARHHRAVAVARLPPFLPSP